MAQRKILNYFALKPNKSTSDDKSNEIVLNIKQEPEVEFIGLLPQFQPDKTLLGNFKVKTETNQKKKKNVKCKICGKEIVLRFMNYHLKMHETKDKGRSYKCKVCLKFFYTEKSLCKHLKTHGHRYQCKSCDRKFIWKNMFENHMKLHEDPKAFECDICVKKFDGRISLKQHLVNVHKGKTFRCRHCPETHKLYKHSIPFVIRKKCPSK
jgi:uncharacterized Zn-finger protein